MFLFINAPNFFSSFLKKRKTKLPHLTCGTGAGNRKIIKQRANRISLSITYYQKNTSLAFATKHKDLICFQLQVLLNILHARKLSLKRGGRNCAPRFLGPFRLDSNFL